MSLRLQIIVVVAMLFIILYIVWQIGKKKLDFKYGIGWLAMFIVVLILAIWPKLLDIISNVLGIASPVNMLFFFGFILSVMIIFSMSKMLGNLNSKVKKLSQELAILRKEVNDNYVRSEDERESNEEGINNSTGL